MYTVHVPAAEELKGTGFEAGAGWSIPGENIARSSGYKNQTPTYLRSVPAVPANWTCPFSSIPDAESLGDFRCGPNPDP
jgi:hypothetical protein